MKFTDGYWQMLPGHTPLRPLGVDEVVPGERGLTAFVATAPISSRGMTLNRPQLTYTIEAVADGVIAVTVEHLRGGVARHPQFSLTAGDVEAEVGSDFVRAGSLTARVTTAERFVITFEADGRVLTTSGVVGSGAVETPDGHYMREQLALGVGEQIFGLGERFGPYVKNGQSVDIWNADGGTSSEQAYKNVPFHLSSAGYGVLVDHPGRVSYEIGSEAVSATQFSVEGHRLRYLVIAGPTPTDVLRRYTGLTGRPALPPAWSFGLWLSTSFTTDYDEATVTSFIDGMAERGIPLSVFHFDCFWMRGFHWCDFVWDPATFPDPKGMLARLHERGLKVCVWINPYIAQRSHLFDEGAEKGYLVKRADGSVWQWDMWQAGMALVDFTNPDAWAWYSSKLKGLLDDGVDAFKTDFGERIPTDVVWHDGADPELMHNYYTQLYNQCVFELLERERGEGEAVLFARSATAGGQQFPVHWGGDCESTFVSMAESLRGGLSLALSGFGFWSHDIGGFEGTPEPAVYKRWVQFGLLSSHSRLHGSTSYRVPWLVDDEAVEVTKQFTELKCSLMPYLLECARVAHEDGVPVMRPMLLEFPDDPTAAVLDRQYMLGPSLLVAPVFDASQVTYYVPEGTWTSLLDGSSVTGPQWVRETHGFDSLPLLVRPGSIITWGATTDRPDYDWADGVTLEIFGIEDGQSLTTRVRKAKGRDAVFTATRSGDEVVVKAKYAPSSWSACLAGAPAVEASDGSVTLKVRNRRARRVAKP